MYNDTSIKSQHARTEGASARANASKVRASRGGTRELIFIYQTSISMATALYVLLFGLLSSCL